MLSVYDLYDLSAIFKNIRAYPDYKLNIEVISKVITVLENWRINHEMNQFRAALRSISGLDKEKYYFADVDNVYVYFPSLLKNERIYYLLISSCSTLKQVLEEQCYDMAFDLADSIHCLPDIIAENNFSITKSYWKTHIESYRNKWDKTFLIEEQKSLRKTLQTR